MKCNSCYLHEMKIGETAVVLSLDTEDSIRRRLIDLGLIQGTRIRCLMRKHHGESAAFLIRGTVIALRKEDACHIRIRPEQTTCVPEFETICQAAECHPPCCQNAACEPVCHLAALTDKPSTPEQ